MKGFSGFGNSPLKTSGADIIKAQAKLDEVELGYKTPRWLKAAEGEGKNEETPAPSPTKVKIDISSEEIDKIMKMIASENEKNRTPVHFAVPATPQTRWPRRGHRSRRGAVRFFQRPQRTTPCPRRRPEARRHRVAALRSVQTLRRGINSDPPVYENQLRWHRPRLVLRPSSRRAKP